MNRWICALLGHKWTDKTSEQGIKINPDRDAILQFWEHAAVYCKRCDYMHPESRRRIEQRHIELSLRVNYD